jgi:hypothetical protein
MTNLEPHRKCRLNNYPIDINTGLLKQHHILLQETQGATIVIGFGRRDVLIRKVTDAEKVFKEYNENENRDWHGRWALQNAGTATLVSPGEGALESGLSGIRNAATNNIGRLGSIFGRLSATTAEGLGDLVLTFAAGATAFLGAYIIPFGRSPVASGTLPGHPGLTYHYDGDIGHFALYNSNNELLFAGTAGGDGLIRTTDGDVIGRRINGSVILDSTLIPTESEDEANTSGQTGAQTQAIATTAPPSLCPDPLPDRPGFKSLRSIAYQEYISTLINPEHPIPPGLAVYFTNPETGKSVAFDDCYHDTGDPTDAKGPGIARMVQNEKMAGFLSLSYRKQAERQINAAPSHRIDWYADEPGAADFFRKIFSDPKFANINVINMPMTMGKLFLI